MEENLAEQVAPTEEQKDQESSTVEQIAYKELFEEQKKLNEEMKMEIEKLKIANQKLAITKSAGEPIKSPEDILNDMFK